jgi:PadR family transcriptional regulator, regulatory protein PadR
MPPRSALSAQTRAVLAALAAQPSEWRHGYDLARETGLKSGTLYPILIRLADRQFVEARWEAEQPAGRPRRHLYRLASAGLAAATAALAVAPAPATPARSRRTAAPRRLAGVEPGTIRS